jgi:hypothetical protein
MSTGDDPAAFNQETRPGKLGGQAGVGPNSYDAFVNIHVEFFLVNLWRCNPT